MTNQKFYEPNEVVERLKQDKLEKRSWTRDGSGQRSKGCFFSSDITVEGNSSPTWSNEIDMSLEDDGEELPGVKCPDCGAQGYRTDHPQVATCGAYPGWFFYYKDKRKKRTVKPKKQYKIMNGQLVEVTQLVHTDKVEEK